MGYNNRYAHNLKCLKSTAHQEDNNTKKYNKLEKWNQKLYSARKLSLINDRTQIDRILTLILTITCDPQFQSPASFDSHPHICKRSRPMVKRLPFWLCLCFAPFLIVSRKWRYFLAVSVEHWLVTNRRSLEVKVKPADQLSDQIALTSILVHD